MGQRQLLQEAWGPAYGKETNYLRVYLAQLCRKLEPDDPRRAGSSSTTSVWTVAVALDRPGSRTV